ncbi:MAG TPA: hypothetical protein VJT14_14435 [Candidatus Dormibacteraeota bacterium]|nr:hypothetical protein [Candidatus Dormibacteraeota bacterium]
MRQASATVAENVLDVGLYPFLIGDAIRLAAAAVVLPAGSRLSCSR